MNSLDNLIFALENANELFVFCEQNYANKKIKELRKRYKDILLEIRELNEALKEQDARAFENYLYKENLRQIGGPNGITSGTKQV